MRFLEIPTKDLDFLFDILDEECTGVIPTDAFFRGCSRLRGGARARDLQQVGVDLSRHSQSAWKQIKTLRKVNDSIAQILDRIDTIEVDIVQDESDEKDPVLMARRGRARSSRTGSAALRRVNSLDAEGARGDDDSELSVASD